MGSFLEKKESIKKLKEKKKDKASGVRRPTVHSHQNSMRNDIVLETFWSCEMAFNTNLALHWRCPNSIKCVHIKQREEIC